MSQKKQKIAGVTFSCRRPTGLDFQDVYSWVIWQIPRQVETGLSGAVRPPMPESCWYPAIIEHKEKRVQVYAHLDESFATPESAADYFFREVKAK